LPYPVTVRMIDEAEFGDLCRRDSQGFWQVGNVTSCDCDRANDPVHLK
jgi:hypothetical protein